MLVAKRVEGLGSGPWQAVPRSPQRVIARKCCMLMWAGVCACAQFTARGFNVFAGPEVPTIIMKGGAVYPGIDGGELLSQFEIALLQLQAQMEDSFHRIARSTGKPSIVVLDRAMPDPGAYISGEQFDEILARIGHSREGIMAR